MEHNSGYTGLYHNTWLTKHIIHIPYHNFYLYNNVQTHCRILGQGIQLMVQGLLVAAGKYYLIISFGQFIYMLEKLIFLYNKHFLA